MTYDTQRKRICEIYQAFNRSVVRRPEIRAYGEKNYGTQEWGLFLRHERYYAGGKQGYYRLPLMQFDIPAVPEFEANSRQYERQFGLDADPFVEYESVTEAELRRAFMRNPSTIEPGLRLVGVSDASEVRTAAGRMDILCIDADGVPTIIELKRHGVSDRHVVGQITAYMGSLKAENGYSHVRGIIVVGTRSAELEHSAIVVVGLKIVTLNKVLKREAN